MTNKQKTVENTLSISSAHEFSDSMHSREEDAENGYVWYFIRQMPKLNGGPGYDTHWVHTRQKVDGESWYVGEGNVALYYVSSYTLESLITKTDRNKDFISKIDTIKIEPVAINNEETHVSSFGYNLCGAFGIEGGKEDGQSGVKGSASLSWGIDFNESPVNIWIWRVPTKHRNLFKTFCSSVQVNVSSIITRCWVKAKHLQAHTENSMLEISVEELSGTSNAFDNRNCRIIITGNNDSKTMSYQNTSQDLESIQVVVSQLGKPAK